MLIYARQQKRRDDADLSISVKRTNEPAKPA